eukprot:TRINITY_DN73185_c0_g1_i1.p1 TRINITY_DN73185_c0_g1~~TRINITY_DN73185_c0_g1_i1.p1  ORF type:complete len:286 (+),score=79.91 TRINITY_DN73185_c0_g1_i1:219-1076(+)
MDCDMECDGTPTLYFADGQHLIPDEFTQTSFPREAFRAGDADSFKLLGGDLLSLPQESSLSSGFDAADLQYSQQSCPVGADHSAGFASQETCASTAFLSQSSCEAPCTPPDVFRRGDVPMQDDDSQCITPEVVTPEESRKRPSQGTPKWTEWRLEADDVTDVITTEGARRLVMERASLQRDSADHHARVSRIVASLQSSNFCTREHVVAKRALKAIITVLINAPHPNVPLTDIKKSLKWKTTWVRELGSLYSFIRRSGRNFLAYNNGMVSLLEPLTAEDLTHFRC